MRASRRQQGWSRRSTTGGFALVEVMLALVLIGLLATIALPGLVRSTGSGILRIATMEASALLRRDRDEALGTGHPTAVVVDEGGIRSVTGSGFVALPRGAAARIAGGREAIRFFGDGRSSGGQLLMASGSARVVISVSPDTGAIVVSAP